MSPLIHSSIGWLQTTIPWSSSRQSRRERIAFLLLLGAAICMLVVRNGLSLLEEVGLWALLLLGVAMLLRRGWVKLFGPVLFYDLVRTARRNRYFFIRTTYALALFAMLLTVYLNTWRPSGIPARQMAQFAESFFHWFMFVQFVVVVILTPAYSAGAITDEKERRTLEFMLATDLRNREIVLSKLVSRLANLTLVVLTGLPILAMLQFIGGIDPNLVLAGFAATGLTMASIAALGILCSVQARRSRDAIVMTYLTMTAYVVLSLLSLLLPAEGIPEWLWPFDTVSWTLEDLAKTFNAGNLISSLTQLGKAWGTSQQGAVLVRLLSAYAIFHGLIIAGCTAWSVVRLRTVAIQQMSAPARKKARGFRRWQRPRLGDQPMVWKEIIAEPGFQFSWMGWIIVSILVLASFVPAVTGLIVYFADASIFRLYTWERFGREMNEIFVRPVGTMVACLMLLAVAVRAAGSISGERERETFDSLLTTPLDSSSILFGKWLGSILSVRWAWVWLGTIWGVGIITGGLSILALPLLLAAWVICAGFLACLGLWYSVVSRTSLRATVWTLQTTFLLSFGHWGLWLCCVPLFVAGTFFPGFEWVAKFEVFVLTPPVGLAFLAFRGKEVEHALGRDGIAAMLIYTILGFAFWTIATRVLWSWTSARFRVVTGRAPVRQPPRLSADRPAGQGAQADEQVVKPALQERAVDERE